MTRKDLDLEADAESTIRERAALAGMDFEQGKWNYRQVLCPVLPNHILLKFTRNNGAGDKSVFTASIPRNGEGRVRIVPILLRSYSLFSPAPINALTISAFNRIRAEEQLDGTPDWLTTGLCYAALAGTQPQVASTPQEAGEQRFSSDQSAVMEVPGHGGATVRFTDLEAAPKAMAWTLVFDAQGKLLKAAHRPASQQGARSVTPSNVLTPKIPASNQERPAAGDNGSELSEKHPAPSHPIPVPQPQQSRVSTNVKPVPVSDLTLPAKPVPPGNAELKGKPVPPGKVDLKGRPIPATDLKSRPIPSN